MEYDKGCFHFWGPTNLFTIMLNVENCTYKYTKYVQIMCTFLSNNIECQIKINTNNISHFIHQALKHQNIFLTSWSHFTKLFKHWSHFMISLKYWNIKCIPQIVISFNEIIQTLILLQDIVKHLNIKYILQIMIPFTNYSNIDPTLGYSSNIETHIYFKSLSCFTKYPNIDPASGYPSSFFCIK